MDKILLSGIRLQVRLGVPDKERANPQIVTADVECEFNTAEAGLSDDFQRTVDYSAVHAVIQDVSLSRPFSLVEALAESIAGAVLEKFPLHGVRVLIRKPSALQSKGVEWAGVEIVRSRRA